MNAKLIQSLDSNTWDIFHFSLLQSKLLIIYLGFVLIIFQIDICIFLNHFYLLLFH